MQMRLASQILASLRIGILVFDAQQRLRMSNAWFDRHAGWDPAPIGMRFVELFPALAEGRAHLALRGTLDQGISSLLSHKLNRTPFPLLHRSGPHAGQPLDQMIEILPLLEDRGERWALVAVHDQSNAVQRERVLRAQAEELREYSFIDSLTGIPNRRRLDQYLADELLRARRGQASLALIMVDVDQFKAYNDLRGHPEGDACLRRIALLASPCLTRPGDLIARYGGEEFAVVLPDTDLVGAHRVAERIRRSIAAALLPHPGSTIGSHVTVSAGVAAIPPDSGLDQQTLLETADRALYQAKREGRNRTVSIGNQL